MSHSASRPELVDRLADLEEEVVLDMVRARLDAGEDPLVLLEEAQNAMRLVGERYAQGSYYISSMMMAAEIFREIMEIVEPIIQERASGESSGHVLIGTVQNDIHDVGKNIFGVLLRCHGFTVTDLGVDVGADRIVETALHLKPDIIALSGLLTIAFDSMKEIVQRIRTQPDASLARTPIIIGGGTVNAMACAVVGADYWAIDALTGVQLCRQILAVRPASS